MDVLRSCYTTKAIFWPGGPEIDIIWYRCKPGAKLFLPTNSFFSLNYGLEQGIVGEVPGRSRPWRNGSPPAGTATSLVGTNRCGTDSEFEDGQGGPGSATFDAHNVRTCCAGSDHGPNPCLHTVMGFPPSLPASLDTGGSQDLLLISPVIDLYGGVPTWLTGHDAEFLCNSMVGMVFQTGNPIVNVWTFLDFTSGTNTWRFQNAADPEFPIGAIVTIH